MKIKRRVSKGKLLISLVVIVVVAAGTAWLIKVRQENAHQQTTQTPETKTPEPIEQPTPKPEPSPPQPTPEPPKDVQLALPGATPITARAENYNADGSLWQMVNPSRRFNQAAYVPGDLTIVDVPTISGRGQEERSIRSIALVDLRAMLAAARAAGVNPRFGSGYRSYTTQSSLYSRYVSQYGEASAATFSAKPGHSEHQSGLAVDFGTASGRCWVSECFESTPEGQWLAAHAHEYGFILRYPNGKQSIVGYQYEPWHFRYVGRELANALKQSGLTLEEAWPHLEKAMAELKSRGKL